MRYFFPASPNELQIDIDSKTKFRQYQTCMESFRQSRHLKIEWRQIINSKTRGHKHISLYLSENLEPIERIALQAILGSDPIRELMNWGRWRNNDPHPILFIESTNKYKEEFTDCHCTNIKRQPRCNCLRKMQTSPAEFPSRSA